MGTCSNGGRSSASGGSNASNKDGQNAQKSFYEMTVQQKKNALAKHIQDNDKRYRHYEFGKFKVYSVAGGFIAIQYKDISDDFFKRARGIDYFQAVITKTLKQMKEKLNV